MVDWLLAHHRTFVRASRLLVVGCAATLLGIANLPRNMVDRIVAIAGVVCVGVVFSVWLAIALITILRPHTFEDVRRRRARSVSDREQGRR